MSFYGTSRFILRIFGIFHFFNFLIFRQQKSAAESDKWRELCAQKDEQVREMRREIDRLGIELGEIGVDNRLKSQRLFNAASESNVGRT